jgi:hypothetical protein
MEREGSARIVRRFNEWQKISDESRKHGTEFVMPPHLKTELDDTTELRQFRKQLADCLDEHQVDSTVSTDPAKWRAFVESYAKVVEACELKCTNPRLAYVSEVIIKFLGLSGINPDELSIVIQWSWVNKRTGHESRTHAFF